MHVATAAAAVIGMLGKQLVLGELYLATVLNFKKKTQQL